MKGVGKCPHCGYWFALKKSGKLVYHKQGRILSRPNNRRRCDGVDCEPTQKGVRKS